MVFPARFSEPPLFSPSVKKASNYAGHLNSRGEFGHWKKKRGMQDQETRLLLWGPHSLPKYASLFTCRKNGLCSHFKEIFNTTKLSN